jgi:hypothetical protein
LKNRVKCMGNLAFVLAGKSMIISTLKYKFYVS